MILNEEKLGGLDFTINEASDFASFITSNALSEVHFSVSILDGMVELRKLAYFKDWIGFW